MCWQERPNCCQSVTPGVDSGSKRQPPPFTAQPRACLDRVEVGLDDANAGRSLLYLQCSITDTGEGGRLVSVAGGARGLLVSGLGTPSDDPASHHQTTFPCRSVPSLPAHLCDQAWLSGALCCSLDGANEVTWRRAGLGRRHHHAQRNPLPAHTNQATKSTSCHV